MLNDIQVSQMESSDNSQNPITSNIIKQHPSSSSQYSSQLDLLPRHATVHSNFGSQRLLPLDVKHFSQAMVQTSVPASLGTYPLAFETKRSMDAVLPTQDQIPMSVYPGLQQFQPTSKLLSRMEPLSSIRNRAAANVGATLSSTSNKMQARVESVPRFRTTSPKIAGSNQLPSIRKRPAETEPLVKVQAEFESVRSKLRESLASALTTGVTLQNKPKPLENDSLSEENNSLKVTEVSYQQNEICPSAAGGSLCESLLNCSTANTQVNKCDGDKNLPIDVSSSVNMGDQKEVNIIKVQEGQPKHDILVDEVPSSNHSVLEDELLQGHGLSWASDFDSVNADAELNSEIKRPKLIHVEENRDTKDISLQISEKLAVQIEAELFKLFGGVNKKYKEKGRSLLFNLKDPSNPELKERVLSGDVPPERLCSMTAEELASKELSQWRQAKAEELAQMVVLPDTDIDIRRVVKKTHKGEFQVEVDQDDDAHVEVAVGSDVLSKMSVKTNEISHTQPRSNDKGLTLSRTNGSKMSKDLLQCEKSDADVSCVSGGADPRLPEKTDYMQDFMVDEFKDTELLPPVVSLDEFMQALDSEPPFENLEINTSQVNHSSVERNLDISKPENCHQLENAGHKLNSTPDISRSKLALENSLDSQLHSGDIHKEHAKENSTKNSGQVDNNKYQKRHDELKANIADVKQALSIDDSVSECKNIWEGLLQLNVSALSTVVSFFLSGEKTTMQEWPGLLEVKGRVRLDAFEKFLQELPLSRSRAIMIVEFRWKEGSQEIGRVHLSEAINSYITDERLGFAEPAPGVELYLCPPHPKITGILANHLASDHIENINPVVNGLIGIIVWRRPHINVSPKVSHHKHGSSKKHVSSRKHQQGMHHSNPTHRPSVPLSNQMPRPDEEDDVPPGFGPPIGREEDDLPEFDFARGSYSRRATAAPAQNSAMVGGREALGPAGPSEHMRELVQKYGQGEIIVRNFGIPVQPWNDDDDIPEWKPNQNMKPVPQPPSLPLPHLHVYQQQQQNTQPFLISQHMLHPQQHMLPPNPQFIQTPLHSPIHPQAAGMQAMPLQNLLQPPTVTWWPAAHRAPSDSVVPIGGLHQPCNFGGQTTVGQPQGVMQQGFGGVQNVLGGTWRPDNSGSRGF